MQWLGFLLLLVQLLIHDLLALRLDFVIVASSLFLIPSLLSSVSLATVLLQRPELLRA